jgi:SAM-dependent methyltransferase
MTAASRTVLGRLRARLVDREVAAVDLESDRCLAVHRAILLRKPLLREVFADFYRTCLALERTWFRAPGLRVEVGAGVSLMREVAPDVLVSDLRFATHLDLCLDALHLPFRDRSVRAVFGLNCFHHLPDPEAFFAELERVLPPGGGCVLIDPYHGPAARLLYRRVHASEGFDPVQPGWERPPDERGLAMTGANQALSYIVFVRDRERFGARHPRLRIVERRPLGGWLRYLLSGGLNFHALVPDALTPVVRGVEAALGPLRPLVGLHHAIVLRRE